MMHFKTRRMERLLNNKERDHLLAHGTFKRIPEGDAEDKSYTKFVIRLIREGRGFDYARLCPSVKPERGVDW